MHTTVVEYTARVVCIICILSTPGSTLFVHTFVNGMHTTELASSIIYNTTSYCIYYILCIIKLCIMQSGPVYA